MQVFVKLHISLLFSAVPRSTPHTMKEICVLPAIHVGAFSSCWGQQHYLSGILKDFILGLMNSIFGSVQQEKTAKSQKSHGEQAPYDRRGSVARCAQLLESDLPQ